ncbi:hypothetical protein P170DRAFT_417125 [Aspergillus steynii IBT 23096]|uniref:Uncharacterized protein n=1 Tax=Aspergillus steynii IBT 23096 TaxID=1392250 RepID=A0A2I2FV33_9EURO|nr:uncharacterized protein P170DRAFT_417125 [Aspergillus steynii IBT 23096]PLB44482.1 hypothetical protein P170DRAFT_417125 [Aspergillus steynii IBT 23096]
MDVNTTNDEYIYTGVWTDWSHGRLHGTTLTLSAQSAGFLTAFLSLFVTVSAAHIWRIITYIVHQLHSSPEPKDAFHHQQQVMFKNTSSPASLAWESILLAWSWRRSTRRSVARSIGFILLALVWMVAAGGAAVLSARMTKPAGDDCLIMSNNCGTWSESNSSNVNDPNSIELFSAIQLQALNSATAYSRTCYAPESENLAQCQLYTQSRLPFQARKNVSCPFADGICFEGDNAAFSLDTGLLDSNHHLGINTIEEERILFRKAVTCSPLIREPFVTVHNDSNPLPDYPFANTTVAAYHYGPKLTDHIQNETFRYDVMSARAPIAYTVSPEWSSTGTASINKTWIPIPALNRTDADVNIIFINANNLRYDYPVDDPIFGAHRSALEELQQLPDVNASIAELNNWWLPDSYTTVLGCTDQYQVCSVGTGSCTPLNGMGDLTYNMIQTSVDLGLNPRQAHVFALVTSYLVINNMFYSVYGRSGASLRAQETVADLSQKAPLPPTQWQIEIQSWFEASLAKLQERSVEFATGPRHYRAQRFRLPATASSFLCEAQKVRCPAGNISFSVLGVAAIIGVGCVIILLGWSLDTVMGWLGPRWFPRSQYKRVNWTLDDKFQLQRMAFEGCGFGDWEGQTAAVPVTAKGQVFGGWRDVDEKHPFLGGRDRVLVTEERVDARTEVVK